MGHYFLDTQYDAICPRSSYPFYILTYYGSPLFVQTVKQGQSVHRSEALSKEGNMHIDKLKNQTNK